MTSGEEWIGPAEALREGLGAVQAYLERQDADPEAMLRLAAVNGNEGAVALSIRYCEDVNEAGADGRTALMLAVENGHASVVEILCTNERVDVAFETFKRAIELGHEEVVEVFLERSVYGEWFLEGGKDEQLLLIAARGGHLGIVEMLVGHGAGQAEGGGVTALITAAVQGESATVAILAGELSSRVDAQDAAGMTALMHAVMGGHVEVVSELLGYVDNLALTNGAGQTALDLAQAVGNEQIIEMLTS